MIKRFDRLDIATSDVADAAAIYEKNFEFAVRRGPNPDEAAIELGDAQLRLRSGPDVAEIISSSGEGLAAIWLETDDVDQIAAKLRQAGVGFTPIRVEGARRILAVNPSSANMVPLFIFDRRES
jgi:glyoxalase/bleomycin resistance protein/dioxygenase superfamily protein